MSLKHLRKRFFSKPLAAARTKPPHPWPVDPELSRRVTEARQRTAQTRKELARHILPERPRDGAAISRTHRPAPR
jgi:hypothetical protein